MEQIIVKKASGELVPLFNKAPFRTVTSAEQSCSLLNEDTVKITVVSSSAVDFTIGDQVAVFGGTYTLNQIPTATRTGENYLEYELLFEGVQYDLLRAKYLNADVSGFYTSGEFSLTGDVIMFMNVLRYNLDRVFGLGVWVLGEIPDSSTKTLTFSNENSLAVLQRICQEFETEFEIVQDGFGGKTIHIRKTGRILPYQFEYGRGRGLYELSRQSVQNQELINRLYAFGSTRNLKSGYRNYSTRLRLPDPGYLEDTDSIAAFGTKEGSVTFEDIYPHREGTVTSIVSGDVLKFVDTTMNFDLNEKDSEGNTKWLIAGTSAKIHFNSGNLAGYEFELSGYDHGSKTFTLVLFTDERGQKFPDSGSVAFQISPGDKYVILDIMMPDSYVTAAEGELQTKALEYLNNNKAPHVQYGLQLDEMYLTNLSEEGATTNFFQVGDYVSLLDEELGIDKSSRVTAFTRNLIHPYQYNLTIADTYEITLIERIISTQKEVNNIIRINDLRDPARARQQWRNVQEALNLVFDQDGYFQDGKIRATTIEAILLAIGAKGQQLTLRGVALEPNFQGDKNVVRVTGGQLIHFTIEEEIRTWTITSQTTSITDNNARYIYVRCRKGVYSSGIVIFSNTQYKLEEGNYYYFLIGTLYSVDSTGLYRELELTYGFTKIHGRWISTGRIQSQDGLTYFDLDEGVISGAITFKSVDGSTKDVRDLNNEFQQFIDNTLPELLEGLENQIDGKVETWFYEGTPTLSNAPAVDWDTDLKKDEHINDLYYNTVNYKTYRFKKVSGVYSWEEVVDERISIAMAAAAAAQDTADGKRRVFVTTPTVPYDVGDLWTDGSDLRRCQTAKTAGQSYNVNDWVFATVYDNTVTKINGGVVTSGTIQLAGPGGSILSGITGDGTSDVSVRIWAGASYENRAFAPFRVLQSGEVFARKRIEMMNESNVGQAGICGANTSGDGNTRIWAGAPYSGRDSAPFRVLADGSMIAKSGQIGDWTIVASGISNNNGSAFISAASGPGDNVTKAVIGANAVSSASGLNAAALFSSKVVYGNNVGAIFEASGGLTNYAFRSISGISQMIQANINGRSAYVSTNNGLTDPVDPYKYDIAIITGNISGGFHPSVQITSASGPIADGKEITIIQLNDTVNLHLVNTIRNRPDITIEGGGSITIFYASGYWYIKSYFNNDF